MRSMGRLLLLAMVIGQTGSLWAASDQEERLQESVLVLQAILDTSDNGIPTDLLAKSECIGIIPSVKKFAFGLGGRYGAGYVLCKKNSGKGAWGAPSAYTLGGGSVGFQLGFSATDYVLLFMNHYGVEKLLQDKFTLGADVTVAAGPVGRAASAATDAGMTAQILSYSRSKGLFAGIALEGAVMRPSNDDNKALYGKEVDAKDILIAGTVPPPASAEPLIRLLSGQKTSAAPAAASSANSPAATFPAATSPTGSPGAKTGPGTFSGSVHDTSGAVIPDAVITVTASPSGASRWVTTNAEGRYSVDGLTAGSYVVNAKATGMTAVTTPPLALEAGSDQIVDFKLESGQ